MKDHPSTSSGQVLENIRQTVDENGVIISAQDYSPYGEIIRSYNNADANDKYKFTEKERDKETNLDYFGARYYDASIGRWLAVDPLASNYPSWTPYNYVLNNSLNMFDPDGKDPWDVLNQKVQTKSFQTVSTNFIKGVGNAIGNTVEGVWNSVTHPVETAENLWNAVTHPVETVENIVDAIEDKVEQFISGDVAKKSEILGELFGVAGEIAVGTKGISKLSKIGETKIFRVFGDGSKADGFSWTHKNPNSVSNFRNAAGLPNANSGRFVVEGTAKKSNIISKRRALPLDGNKGGIKEYIVDPKNVNKTRVSGVNPEF